MAEYSGFLVIIAREVAATPGTYAAFGQVKDIDGPSGDANQIETSHRDSAFRKYQAGMRDGGEVTFDIVFDPNLAAHDPTLATSVYKDWELGRMANYKISFPGVAAALTTCIFAAFTSAFSFSAPMEDALVASLTLKVNGVLTWAHVP